ncbi:hypothetical protein [Pseudomonas farris]
MLTSLRQDDFPTIYKRMVALFPGKPWLKRVSDLQHQIIANPIAKGRLRQVNQVAYGLASFDDLGLSSVHAQDWELVKTAMCFAGQVLSIIESDTPDRARRFAARVHGALRNPDDMRGMQFELSLATHLFRQGCAIQWMEEHGGGDTFDMLVDIPGVGAIELECKTLSSDKGDAIPHDVAIEFINRLIPCFEKSLPAVSSCLFGIEVVFEGRVPSSVSEQMALSTQVGDAIARQDHSVSGLCRIELNALDLRTLPDEIGEAELTVCLDQMIGTEQSHQVIKVLCNGSFLAVRMRSTLPNTLELKINAIAKKAIRKQMTGKRPGYLVIRIEGHTGESLVHMAENEENALAILATKLLRNPQHTHLAGVVFVSAPALNRLTETTESGQSHTYIFANEVGRYPHLDIGKVFAVQ